MDLHLPNPGDNPDRSEQEAALDSEDRAGTGGMGIVSGHRNGGRKRELTGGYYDEQR